MRIFLMTLLLMFGSQATAEMDYRGSEAVDLVLKATKKGLILKKSEPVTDVFFIKMVFNGRYYRCKLMSLEQWCIDDTGYAGNKEN